MAIEWSRRARIDILDLREYLGKDSPIDARRFVERMISAIENLETFPTMGRRVPEADGRDDMRELIYRGYRIIYQTRANQLFIVTIIHGSRNLQGQPKKPWE